MKGITKLVTLRRLTLNDEEAFYKAKDSWIIDPGFEFFRGYEDDMVFSSYLELLNDHENGKRLPKGFVADTSLFGFLDNGEIIGRLSLRHELTEFLMKIGGHIGYGVLPMHRRKGYATSMLRQSLLYAKEINLKKVLVTCDDNNVGSIKTIEACNGIFENSMEQENDLPQKRRYWISI